MKKTFLSLAILASIVMIQSCNVKGEKVNDSDTEEHEWVDLGLPSGTKWATMNIGASSPTDYGDYFAWGELSAKDLYTENNYTYPIETASQRLLSTEQDAAVANWGAEWSMPTKTQYKELLEYCECSYEEKDGVLCFMAVGPNGNYIFFPLAGEKSGLADKTIRTGEIAYYLTRERDTRTGSPFALEIFKSKTHDYDDGSYYGYHAEEIGVHNNEVRPIGVPYCGHSIRPVLTAEEKEKEKIVYNDSIPDTHEYVDLGLSVAWATCNIGANSPEGEGYFFAWGEVHPKNRYQNTDYRWDPYNSTAEKDKYGASTHKNTLDAIDDAATVNWGSRWRMPTKEESLELMENVSFEWQEINGVWCAVGTSNINGNTIILPKLGHMKDCWYNDDILKYWSSNVSNEQANRSSAEILFQTSSGMADCDRYLGLQVRAVRR